MSSPRRVLPECTQLVTRRTVDRKFLLRPSAEVNLILRYLLALYATRHAVSLHAFVVLSNHLHLLKTDEQAEMPAFMRDLNAQTTRRINQVLERQGALWDPRKYSNVEVYGEQAAWDKLVYLITNPVKHGLVETPGEWPGVISLLSEIRRGTVTVSRPNLPCFRNSTLPEQVELRLTAPPALGHLSHEEYVAELERRVATRVAELNAAARAEGRSYLGAAHVESTEPEEKPLTPGSWKQLTSSISCLEDDRGLLSEQQELLKIWRAAYREARRQWPTNPRVVFPCGTYAMRVLHNARIAPQRNL